MDFGLVLEALEVEAEEAEWAPAAAAVATGTAGTAGQMDAVYGRAHTEADLLSAVALAVAQVAPSALDADALTAEADSLTEVSGRDALYGGGGGGELAWGLLGVDVLRRIAPVQMRVEARSAAQSNALAMCRTTFYDVLIWNSAVPNRAVLMEHRHRTRAVQMIASVPRRTFSIFAQSKF